MYIFLIADHVGKAEFSRARPSRMSIEMKLRVGASRRAYGGWALTNGSPGAAIMIAVKLLYVEGVMGDEVETVLGS
jgi:hypothetical protein